jgi:hypothetical protein
LATGIAIPHGLWDVTHNIGYVQIGTSHDTGEFACDSVRYWWNTYGQQLYPDAPKILLLCDGGGSNSARHYIFKQDLQALVNELGIEIIAFLIHKRYIPDPEQLNQQRFKCAAQMREPL